MMEQFKRILLPVLLALLLTCSWLSPLDSLATKNVDAGLKRALISFATARTLNGVISVAQGTQVTAQPWGFGVNLAAGQILDPVNELVEQFSDLMLISSVSFGVQKVLISMSGHWLVSSLLTMAALLCSFIHFRHLAMPAWLTKVLVIAISVRLVVPMVTVGTDMLFQHFLAADYAASQKIIEAGATDVKKLKSQGLLDNMKGLLPDLNIGGRFDGFLKAAEQWPEQMIRLMVIFLLQTLIMPLALLWVLVTLAKSILGRFN